MNRILRYSGSKLNFISKINPVINESKATHFYEPFIGSGAVFINLQKEFDSYHINDLDKNLIRIGNTIKLIGFSELRDIYDDATIKFGDIGESKDSYYGFRQWFNETHGRKDTLEEGVYLMMLYNSCINSLARFGEGGFNQGYGNRNYTKNYNRETHESVKSKLMRTEITNCDFFDLEFQRDSLLFLDPPYIERPSSYDTITEDQFHNFIKRLKESPNEILYTDIQHDGLDWKYIPLRDKMITTSPLKKKTMITGKFEVMYYNYEVKRNELF